MTGAADWRVITLGIATAGLVALAVATTCRFAGGPPKPFAQETVPPKVREEIEAMRRGLLALPAEPREARLRELASPKATPETLLGVAALLGEMEEAASCKLIAADAYGTNLVKAIYEVVNRDGVPRRIGLVFERQDAALAILDTAH